MKITSKRRAYLKKNAMDMKAIIRVGKDGISDNLSKSLLDALTAREVVKVKMLQNSELEIREVAEDLAKKTGADLINIVGKTILFFKENKEKPTMSKKLKEI